MQRQALTVTALLLSFQLAHTLQAYQTSCGGMAPRLLSLNRLRNSADLTLDKAADLLWVTDGPTLNLLRYSTGDEVKKVELSYSGHPLVTGSTSLPRKLGTANRYAAAGVASMSKGRVAVVGKEVAAILIFAADPLTGEVTLQQKVQLSITLRSLAYNVKDSVFYGTPAVEDGSVTVVRVDMEGKVQVLFEVETAEALAWKGGEISSIHYSDETKSLFVLCAACGSMIEVNMSGEVIGQKALSESEEGAVAVSAGSSGNPLLLLTKEGKLLSRCLHDEMNADGAFWDSTDGRYVGGVTRGLLQDALVAKGQFQVVPQVSCKDANRDIQREVSQEECAAACASDVGCVAYTYNTVRRDCFTKSNCEERESNEDDVTGVKVDEGGSVISDTPVVGDAEFQVVPHVSCKDENRDIKRGVTQEECAAACSNDFGCIAYTYNTVRLDCFTKAACEEREDNDDDVTGFKILTGALVSDTAVVEDVEFQVVPRVSCKDGNRDVVRDVTQEDCAAACAADFGCVAYTYNTVRRDCFTKSNCDERENNEDDVTGIKIEGGETGAQSGVDLFQVVPEMSCKDDTRDTLRDVTQADCAAACAADTGCVAYTFNTVRGDCFTKSSCEDREDNEDDVTGIKNIDAGMFTIAGLDVSQIATDFQLVPGSSCKDETRERKGGISLEECAAACRSDDGCAAFTFNTKSDVCYTKSVCAEREPNGDDVTGVRVEGGPGAPPSSTEFIVVEGLSCKDDDLAVFREVSQTACQSLCDVDHRCVTFTYNARRKDCFTKLTCDDREPNDDDVTGFKVGSAVDPPTPAPGGAGGEGGALLSAAYIPLVGIVCDAQSVSTFPATEERASCENLCTHRSSCRVYQYSSFTRECWLKSDCDEKRLVAGAVSFQKPEPDEDSLRSLGADFLFDGYDYSVTTSCKDPSLEVFRDVHLTECETRCTSSLACTAFTFNVRKRNCFLKATCLEAEPNDDDFSGIKRNAVGEQVVGSVPPSSKYEFMVTNNLSCKDPSIAIFRDVDQSTCENACAADPRCTVFTFNRRQSNCFLKAVCRQRSFNADDASGVKVEREQPPTTTDDDGTTGQEQPPDTGTTAPVGDESGYRLFFGIACDDPDVLWLPGIEQPRCESICTNTRSCVAYTSVPSTFDCRLKFSCNEQVFSLGAVSGVRKADSGEGGVESGNTPAPTSPPRTFSIIDGVGCKDPHLGIEREVSLEVCQATCAADPSCRAFTWNRTRRDCYLKNTCADSQLVDDDVSGLVFGLQL